MSSPNWSDDDDLMVDIRTALHPTSVDGRVLEAARAAFSWRTVDAELDVELELAQLFYDSYLDEDTLVRGPSAGSRTLTFQGEQLGVEVELSGTGIQGQLLPPNPGLVTLRTATGRYAAATADEVGCFALPAPPRGPMRLECVTDTGRMTTDWVTV